MLIIRLRGGVGMNEIESLSPSNQGMIEVKLLTDRMCEDHTHRFRIVSEYEEIEFNLENGECKRFMMPVGQHYQVEDLTSNKSGVMVIMSHQKGVISNVLSSVCIKKTYHYEAEVIPVSGQIYWEFDPDKDIVLPPSVLVEVYDDAHHLVASKIVCEDDKDRWSFSFLLPKYHEDQSVIDYEVKAESLDNFDIAVLGYNIKITHYDPISIYLQVCHRITGAKSTETLPYLFQIVSLNDGPMPDNDVIEIADEGMASFLPIHCDRPGNYRYEIIALAQGATEQFYEKDSIAVEIDIRPVDLKLEVFSIQYIRLERFYSRDCACFTTVFER